MSKKTVLPTYTGPSLADCLKVEDPWTELKDMGEEPRRAICTFGDDPIMGVESLSEAAYAMDGHVYFTDTDKPQGWTDEQFQKGKAHSKDMSYDRWHRQLHIVHIDRWVRTLPLKVRWALVQDYETKAYPHSKEDFGESQRRYTAEAEVNRRCTHAVWITTKEDHESNQQARTAEAADSTAEAQAVPQVQLRRKRKTTSTATLPLTK